MQHTEKNMNQWANEVEYIHVQNALKKTRAMVHPRVAGLRDIDMKEIKAYNIALDNFVLNLSNELKN